MKKTNLLILILLATSIVLTGCASRKKKAVEINGEPLVETELTRAAWEIKKELVIINGISSKNKTANTNGGLPRSTASIPQDFKRFVTINYDGDFLGFLQDLKKTGLYEIRIVGNRPVRDVPISIHRERIPMWEILEDVGVQLGNFGTIAIQSKVVVITFSTQE